MLLFGEELGICAKLAPHLRVLTRVRHVNLDLITDLLQAGGDCIADFLIGRLFLLGSKLGAAENFCGASGRIVALQAALRSALEILG